MILMHGDEIPRVRRQSEAPVAAVLIVAGLVVLVALGTWKACEIVVWVAKMAHEAEF
jgi:hypothetical protein